MRVVSHGLENSNIECGVRRGPKLLVRLSDGSREEDHAKFVQLRRRHCELIDMVLEVVPHHVRGNGHRVVVGGEGGSGAEETE